MGSRARWLLAEAVVIVLGVLIALGLDAWYGTLVEARAEQVYLEQLIEDLRSTEAQFEAAAERTEPAELDARALLAHIRALPPNPDSIRQWLVTIQDVDNPVPVLGTAEALVSTGDLRLVEDSDSRAAITRWLSRSRDFWLVPLYQLEEWHRATLTGILHAADRSGLEPWDRGGVAVADGSRSATRPPFTSNAEQFASDPLVHSLVADLVEVKESMAAYRRSMAAEASELRRILEVMLES